MREGSTVLYKTTTTSTSSNQCSSRSTSRVLNTAMPCYTSTWTQCEQVNKRDCISFSPNGDDLTCTVLGCRMLGRGVTCHGAFMCKETISWECKSQSRLHHVRVADEFPAPLMILAIINTSRGKKHLHYDLLVCPFYVKWDCGGKEKEEWLNGEK